MKFRETGEGACCWREQGLVSPPAHMGCCSLIRGDKMAAGGEVEGLPPGQLLMGVWALNKGLSHCDQEWDSNESNSGFSAASGVLPALGSAIPVL